MACGFFTACGIIEGQAQRGLIARSFISPPRPARYPTTLEGLRRPQDTSNDPRHSTHTWNRQRGPAWGKIYVAWFCPCGSEQACLPSLLQPPSSTAAVTLALHFTMNAHSKHLHTYKQVGTMLRLLSSGRAGLLASSVNGGASVSTPAGALARRRLQQGANAGVGQARLITRFPDKQGAFGFLGRCHWAFLILLLESALYCFISLCSSSKTPPICSLSHRPLRPLQRTRLLRCGFGGAAQEAGFPSDCPRCQ